MTDLLRQGSETPVISVCFFPHDSSARDSPSPPISSPNMATRNKGNAADQEQTRAPAARARMISAKRAETRRRRRAYFGDPGELEVVADPSQSSPPADTEIQPGVVLDGSQSEQREVPKPEKPDIQPGRNLDKPPNTGRPASRRTESNVQPGVILSRPGGQQQTAPKSQTTQSSSGAPALKLNLDLDTDIEIKAKIYGSITLSFP
ncbi:hypothetical protein FZEAL_5321 [Fusarium zealandicum]|uniref:Uncharacterized protein n=1 Tax=Fusarium zealandicum TaxID=1053134 RepID=A0A8H4XKQ0_9HYPO|nr:hypothetical protein FZEAL_5321 [Fusarium zealandicum]